LIFNFQNHNNSIVTYKINNNSNEKINSTDSRFHLPLTQSSKLRAREEARVVVVGSRRQSGGGQRRWRFAAASGAGLKQKPRCRVRTGEQTEEHRAVAEGWSTAQ